MPRPTRQQIDDEILETAAALFARHGFRETSVQRIADAVGYSKTGLLHRYPTKEALQQAVVDRGLRDIRALAAEVAGEPPGPARDRAVIGGMARLALAGPGTVALLLSGLTSGPDSDVGRSLAQIGDAVFAAFGADPQADPVRLVRITGALGALAVASIALRDAGLPDAGLANAGLANAGLPGAGAADALGLLIDLGFDALGHGRTTLH